MSSLNEQGVLTRQFEIARILDVSGKDAELPLDNDANSPKSQIAEGLLRGIQVQMDNGSIQELGGALRGADSVTATKVQEDQRRQKEKKDREARRLQALLDELAAIDTEIAALEGQINELNERIDTVDSLIEGLQDGSISVEEALQNPEVIEALRNSGKTIDPNDPDAADALAAVLGTHRVSLAGERDGLQGQLDGLNRRRDDIVNDVKEIDNDLGLSIEDKRASAAKISREGYGQANVVAKSTQTEEIEADALNFQDASSDSNVASDHDIEQSNAALDDLFSSESALDFASADFGKQFAAVTPPVTDNQVELAKNSDLKLENGMT
ncbi:hypothetical protein [Roseobacter sp. MH60115]|uniref:hypothetical protein n=1 Tax=Roseobacter sp. MH60115 TaxID=2785324 RepID=UPI0018A27C61|nr:hypothetical protein [Roseobacter sp. MH60115]